MRAATSLHVNGEQEEHTNTMHVMTCRVMEIIQSITMLGSKTKTKTRVRTHEDGDHDLDSQDGSRVPTLLMVYVMDL